MKLVTFIPPDTSTAKLGALGADEKSVVDLLAVQERSGEASSIALASMQHLIEAGDEGLSLVGDYLTKATAKEAFPLTDVRLLAPLPRPEQIRDCLCFEEHLVGSTQAAAKLSGQEYDESNQPMLNTFRKQPIYYNGNRFAVVGPDVDIVWPAYSQIMDYELEIGAVIGSTARDVSKEAASGHIFGYTIFNDLSARDTQVVEMAGMLGPAKSKDFDGANILGPCIVTSDEFSPENARMSVRINGETVAEGNSGAMYYSFADLIEFISRHETLHPGEVLGSGTVGKGSGFELGRLLESGDVVELEVEGIGVLRNRIFSADATY